MSNKIKSHSSVWSNNIIGVIELLEGLKSSFELTECSLKNNDIKTAASVLFDFCNVDENLAVVLNNHLYHSKKEGAYSSNKIEELNKAIAAVSLSKKIGSIDIVLQE